ncbi:MAG TPA: hypothetical protein VFZ40_19275 [Pyrinomonadaceae bacterium]
MDYNPYYFAVGYFILAIFVFKPGLLIKDFSYRLILAISFVLFVLGLALHFTPQALEWGAGALLAPLLTLAYFRFCRKLFIRFVRREPVDTAFNWAPELVKDRAFAFAYFFGGILIILATIFVMHRLAEAGW